MKWKVESWFVDHWDDADWSFDGKSSRYESQQEAEEAIDEFVRDVEQAIETGDIDETVNPREAYRAVMAENE